jgi:hypothetical protein
MGGTGIGAGLMEIAMALISIALIAMLVRNASNVDQIVQTGSTSFGNLLNTVTMANGQSAYGING